MARTTAGPDAATAARRPRGLLVVAAAGYGKTTFLEGLDDGAPVCVRAAAELAGTEPAGWLTAAPGGSGPADHLVIDDVGDLPQREQLALARAAATLPGSLQVSLAGRRPVQPRVLSALRRPLLHRGPADLALTPAEVTRVLAEEHDVPRSDAVPLAADLTAGWPMLVHLAGTALAAGAGRSLLGALADPGTAAAAWIQEHVLAPAPADAQRALDLLADLDPVTLPLLTAIAAADGGSLDADRLGCAVEWLTATGLLVARSRPDELRLVPLVAQVLSRAEPSTSGSTAARRRAAAERVTRRSRAAADWYAGNGHQLAGAVAAARAGDPEAAGRAVAEHGAEMVAAGAAAAVIALVESLPAGVASRFGVRLIHGDALRSVGQPAAAATVLEPLRHRPEASSGVPPELAWRLGMLLYMQGDFARAEAECAGALPGSGTDAVLVEVCRASALAALGETVRSAELAGRALLAAQALHANQSPRANQSPPAPETLRSAGIRQPVPTRGDGALGAAHLAVALTAAGARRDEHLAQALSAAERARDLVLQARILTNQVDGLLRQARYPQAVDLADRAVRAAEQGPPGLLATALCNQGEAQLRLGRFDEAATTLERAVRVSRRVGLHRTAMGLWLLAEVHQQCGRPEQARTGFEEAIDLARDAGDVQVLAPALIGLSRLLLNGPVDDLATARTLAEEAERVAPPRLASPAVLARGRVVLATGDRAAAREAATAAVAIARGERRMDHLADALEFAAAVSAETSRTRALLLEAGAIWHQAGAAPFADRITLLVGRLPGAGGTERSAAKAAVERLSQLGVEGAGTEDGEASDGVTAPVRVRVLGGFEVLVGGRAVPLPAWRSKQARTLVKILVARRGRPVLRAELCELLWPDSDPARTAHRLSVLLSVVRTVLDPQHLWPVDHYLRADPIGLSLDREHIAVDAEGLLRDAAHATRLIREGHESQARQVLTDVDQLYRGTAFEEEPSEDWASGLREEVRAIWLRSLRQLADLSRAAGDLRQAATLLVRLLSEDPYDEDAHHLLVRVMVRSRRHGEARRAFDRWEAAMRDIGAPLPDPGVLGTTARA